jgi:diaminopimelate epimerase
MVYKMKPAGKTEVDLRWGGSGSRGMVFTKLHGNGNDFILIDELLRELVPENLKSTFAIRNCHRNFGIGGDGVLFLTKSVEYDLGMRLFQPDGSEAEMCGNGVRCLAKYAWDMGYVGQGFTVETKAGPIPIHVRMIDDIFWARLEMGVPRFDRSEIPASGRGEFLKERMNQFEVSAVNTGVPHAVIFVDDLNIPINDLAPPVRNNPVFPEGANVDFVRAGEDIEIRVFERGIEAETLSCGTGAVASATVARRFGLAGDEVHIKTRGGPLIVTFEGDLAFLEGPAVTVYWGSLDER